MGTKRRAPQRTELGELIKRKREGLGWSQEQLADAADLSQETISGIERGITPTPRLATLRKLAAAVRLDVADLYIAAYLADTRTGADRIERRAIAIAEVSPVYDADDPRRPIVKLLADIDDPATLVEIQRYVIYKRDTQRRPAPLLERRS